MRQFRQYKFIFLLIAAVMSSGYGFRCLFFCSDQTGMQNDYVAARDECRSYSQAKIDDPANDNTQVSEKAIQAKMVSAFSECMAKKGWDVPFGDKNKTASKEPPAPIIPLIPKSETPPAPVVAPAPVITPVIPVATRQTLPPPLPVQQQPAPIRKPLPQNQVQNQEVVKAQTVAPVSLPQPAQLQPQLPQPAQSPEQMQIAAPVQAVTAKALDAPQKTPQKTTADVNKIAKYRATECAIARRSALLSAGAMAKTKECDLECTSLLKASPKILPSACPTAIGQK